MFALLAELKAVIFEYITIIPSILIVRKFVNLLPKFVIVFQ